MPEVSPEVIKVRVDLPDVTHRVPGKTPGIPAALPDTLPGKRARGSKEESVAAYSSANSKIPSGEWILVSTIAESP